MNQNNNRNQVLLNAWGNMQNEMNQAQNILDIQNNQQNIMQQENRFNIQNDDNVIRRLDFNNIQEERPRANIRYGQKLN